MKEFDREVLRAEEKLISEIEGMKKFSFKKLLKVIELEALLSYYNK
ncbi:MAG: hypothetical protein IKB08_09945 [Clostridia bacterium]|nr:hypothetical protein [Clostridia bacterium]